MSYVTHTVISQELFSDKFLSDSFAPNLNDQTVLAVLHKTKKTLYSIK